MTKKDNAKSLEKLYKDEIEKTGLKIVKISGNIISKIIKTL